MIYPGQIGADSTSTDVNEASGGLILAVGRVLPKKNKIETKKKTRKNPPHPEHTTKAAAARRLTRDDARKNTSHALAHTRPLP